MKSRWLRFAVNTCLALGFGYYAFRGTDYSLLLDRFKEFDLAWFGAAALLFFLVFLFLALRLSYLLGPTATTRMSMMASLVGTGANNLLPAKLGEVVKILYLCNHGQKTANATGAVFWERFFDLNFVMLIGIFCAYVLQIKYSVLPLSVLVGSIWLALICMLRFADITDRLICKFIRPPSLRDGLQSLLKQFRSVNGGAFYGTLSILTVALWASNVLMYQVIINDIVKINLSFGEIVTVFVISILGLIAPTTPGGLGLFEAAMVFSLGMYGVTREQALATALAIRFFQFFIPVISALLYLAKSGIWLTKVNNTSPGFHKPSPPCPNDNDTKWGD